MNKQRKGNECEQRKPLPEHLRRAGLFNMGRLNIKQTLVELEVSALVEKFKFPDQPDIRNYDIWYCDFVTAPATSSSPGMELSPTGNSLPTVAELSQGAVSLTLVDYDAYKVYNQKPAYTLVTPQVVNNGGFQGLAGQKINWTQSYIESAQQASLPTPPFSFLMDIGYSFYLDWRDDPITSFADKR